MTITFTTSSNQKNNTIYNVTTIDLGECETSLRNYYNLTDNEVLYIKKVDVKQEGMKIPKIEYSVYCKFSGPNLKKLNLSVCEHNKMSLSLPVEISENLDKLNSSSAYFSDICYSSTSDNGTDILLTDRKKEFIEGNKTICQDDCDFSDYDKNKQKANCSCSVKEESNRYTDMNINKTKLYENFGEIKNNVGASNLGITSCNVFSSKENIESNTGFFLLLIIIALFIVVFIIFCTKGYNLLENKIDDVIYNKFKNNKQSKNENNIINKLHTKKNKNKLKKDKKPKNKRPSLFSKQKKSEYSSNIHFKNSKIKDKIQHNHFTSILPNQMNNETEESNVKPDTDYEFDWLSYQEALRYDKRTCCDYYCSLIRSKQLFIFTFCSFNDYNSGIIKKFMLFLSFALHYTINALFFTDSTIHQIYKDNGKYNFKYQISHILYSAIIATFILRLMLQTLVLTDKDVLTVKQQHSKTLAINTKEKKLKCMKIKFSVFFILNFILLGLFWYYLTCFNAVFKNTQVYLIENTFISFAFSLSYPFIINIFPTCIRNLSLNSSKKEQFYFYKMSQIIQLI